MAEVQPAGHKPVVRNEADHNWAARNPAASTAGIPVPTADRSTAAADRGIALVGQDIAAVRIVVAGTIAEASIGRAIADREAFPAEASACQVDSREATSSAAERRLADRAPIEHSFPSGAVSMSAVLIPVKPLPTHPGADVRFDQVLRTTRSRQGHRRPFHQRERVPPSTTIPSARKHVCTSDTFPCVRDNSDQGASTTCHISDTELAKRP